jgi:hypothetical protein
MVADKKGPVSFECHLSISLDHEAASGVGLLLNTLEIESFGLVHGAELGDPKGMKEVWCWRNGRFGGCGATPLKITLFRVRELE